MSAPVQFTLAELWSLHDVVRHDEERGDERERARYPLVSTRLNEEIALAINACTTTGMTEYTFFLSYAEMLLIDAHVRRSMKTPEGARGSDILLKLFAARAELSTGFLTRWPAAEETFDRSYADAIEEVPKHAASDDNPDTNPDTNSGS